jgi:hypothetical protein
MRSRKQVGGAVNASTSICEMVSSNFDGDADYSEVCHGHPVPPRQIPGYISIRIQKSFFPNLSQLIDYSPFITLLDDIVTWIARAFLGNGL